MARTPKKHTDVKPRKDLHVSYPEVKVTMGKDRCPMCDCVFHNGPPAEGNKFWSCECRCHETPKMFFRGPGQK